jgi:hypothetical protein
MRKVTQQTASALLALRPISVGNTTVTISEDGATGYLSLHGHTIAVYDSVDDLLTLKDCGYQTNTTKERLNGVLDVFDTDHGIFQKDFTWYIDHPVWGVQEWADSIVINRGFRNSRHAA